MVCRTLVRADRWLLLHQNAMQLQHANFSRKAETIEGRSSSSDQIIKYKWPARFRCWIIRIITFSPIQVFICGFKLQNLHQWDSQPWTLDFSAHARTWKHDNKIYFSGRVDWRSILPWPLLLFCLTILIWIEVLLVYIEFQRNAELDPANRNYPGGK